MLIRIPRQELKSRNCPEKVSGVIGTKLVAGFKERLFVGLLCGFLALYYSVTSSDSRDIVEFKEILTPYDTNVNAASNGCLEAV
jgi:hypothetical protein